MLGFCFCMCVFFIIWLLVPFCPLIYYSPKNHQIEKAPGRLSEWSESEMVSFSHYASVPAVWHVLYIFPVPTSLNKYTLMYSSQEMKFHATDLFLPRRVLPWPLARPAPPSLPLPLPFPAPHLQRELVPCDVLLQLRMVTTHFITFPLTECLCSLWLLYFKETALDFLNYS